ncbi:Ig-like domain repeat protein [Variovorax sp. tm]
MTTLGQRGVLGSSAQGRNGEQSFVNASNGNLVLQDLDDKLIGRGLDINVVRTYNSQGLLNDDNGDNWTVGAFGQRVVLTGTVATAGSTLARTDRDGASATYTWDAARNLYVSSAGAGAFDTIGYDSTNARYTWTDGATGLVERYESTGSGRLISVTDPAGNTVSYAYNANGTLQRMVDANGETTWFDYSGSNLTQVRTAATDGTVLTRVRYAYDTANRLSSVAVDLNPEDNSIADGKVYVTTYTYDGTSKRVASVTQTDGTKHNFSYVEAGGVYKVATVTDALGAVTRFSYDITQNTTTITDPLGAQSTYLYDAQGQLLQMRQGVTAGNPSGLSQISYRYDAAGNVTGVTDGEGREVAYEYDASGNLLKETDSAGNLHTRTYNAANQLLTDTVYADAAVSRGAFSQPASLPEITRYIYAQDNPRFLRFVLSPQGGVTEHRYNSYGQALATVRYTGSSYNVTLLGASAVPTEAQMSAWVGSQDLRRTERDDRAYDARGALSSSTTYGEVDASGAGVAATAARTQYVYDQHGQLLKSIDPGAGTTTYIYDGLGRVLSISAPSLDGGATPNTTITSYDDAGGKTSVTVASGLVTISAYDKAGRLVSVTQQSQGTGVLGSTTYAYDKDGNLLMTQDPTGVRKWMLYDEAGRKIADIDATGAVIEYVYSRNGQLRQTIAYATRINTTVLVDAAGKPTTAWVSDNRVTSLPVLRPATMAAQDQKVWRFYDNAGRLAWQVDALGYVTQTTYDGASRVLGVTQLANPIDVAPLIQGANVDLGVDPSTLGGIALTLDSMESTPLGHVMVLTATVEGTTPGGMVSFFDGETIIGSAPVIDGKALLVTDRLSVGTHNLRVAYSGDALRPASISKTVKKFITPAATTATLTYLSPAAGSSDPLTLRLTVAANQPSWVALPGGKVVFYNGDVVLSEAMVVNGVANLSLNSWPSMDAFVARLPKGLATAIVASGIKDDLVLKALSLAINSVVASNAEVAYSAISSKFTEIGNLFVSNLHLPGGVVFNKDVIGPLSNGLLDTGKQWPEIRSALSAISSDLDSLSRYGGLSGKMNLRAEYAGDALHTGYVVQTQVVPTPPSITLSASTTRVTDGRSVTLSAQVMDSRAGGRVDFFVKDMSTGNPVIKFLGTANVVNGMATLVVNSLPAGMYTWSATYSNPRDLFSGTLAQGPALQVDMNQSNSSQWNTVDESVDGGYSISVSGMASSDPVTGMMARLRISDREKYLGVKGTYDVFIDNSLIGSFTYDSYSWERSADFVIPIDIPRDKADHRLTIYFNGHFISTLFSVDNIAPQVLTSTTLSVSSATAQEGSPVTLRADVSPVLSDYKTDWRLHPNAISGIVTFYANGVAIGTATAVNGQASLVINSLLLGINSITASYAGNDNYSSSTSAVPPPVTVPATLASTTTTLTSSQATLSDDAALTLTASVSTSTGSTTFGGTVDFYNGTTLLGSATVVNGRAILTVDKSQTSVGTNALRAVFSGDANTAGSTGTYNQVVVQAVPSMVLSASKQWIYADSYPVTFTVQVNGVASGGLVSFFIGSRMFFVDPQCIGTATVVNGVATLTVGSLPKGNYGWSASYSSGNGTLSNVAQEATNYLDVEGEPRPAIDGTSGYQLQVNGAKKPDQEGNGLVTLGATPTVWLRDRGNASGINGVFGIFVDGNLVGSVVNNLAGNPSNADLQFALPAFSWAGEHKLTLVFTPWHSGQAEGRSFRITTTIKVDPASTSLTLSTPPSTAPVGSTITLNATVSAVPSAGATPLPLGPLYGGTVTFYANGKPIGTADVRNGIATLAVDSLLQGATKITATYSGNNNYLSSQTVDSSSKTIQIAGNVTSSSIIQVTGTPVSLTNLTTAVIAKDGALSVRVVGKTPTGLVSFYSGTNLLGTVTVMEDGTATLRGVPIPAGTHTFSAVYSGDELNADGALSFTQVVEGTPTTPVWVGLDITQDRTATQLFNRNGQLQGVLDAEGYLTEYKYNAAGEQVQTIRYAHRAANFSSVSARMMAMAIARASGDLAGVRPEASAGDIRSYNFYNARGQLVGQVDGEGYLTETIYDARGNITQTRRYAALAKTPGAANATLATIRPDANAQDQTVTQTWSAANQLLSRTNVEGTVTTFTYDVAGRLVQTTTAAGTADERITRQRYDSQGRLIAELDGRGSDVVALADALSKWSANGSTHTYDTAGRRTSTTDANGHRTLFFYDALGRLTYTVNALGEVTESRYNVHGLVFEQIVYGTRVNVSTLGATTPGGLNTDTLKAQLAAVADPAKDTHVLSTYNATGTKATIVDGLGNTTSYSYNAFREVTASTQTRLSGQVVTNTVAFDRRGQQISSTLDSTGAAITRRNSYDAFGRVNTRTDANGNTTNLRYDRLGRVVTTTDANSAEHITTYDAFDRVLTQRDALGNVTSYTYNLADRSVTVTTPEGVSVTTVHNRQGQTSSITDGRGNTTTYSYDKSGNLLQTQAPEGVGTSTTYDKIGLKLSTTDARGTVTTYGYDAANRLLTRTVDPTGLQLTTSYQYDAKGQAIRVTDSGGIVTVTEYDLNGQVASQTVDPSNGAYVGLNLRTVYTHDTDGTTLSVQGPDGRLTRYNYDGAGRRIKEQVDPLGLNLTRSYAYDGEGNVVKSIDGQGNATLFIYDKANRLAFTIDAMGGVQQNSYDAEGRLIRQSTYTAFVPVAAWNGVAPSLSTMQALLPTLGAIATQSRRYDRDGRLSFSVDATGAVVKYSYDAGGNVIEARAYAQRIDLSQWNGVVDPPVVADDAHDQRSRNVYDALGRKTYTIDGTGAVVRQVFDAAGNIKERFAYSLRVPVATAATPQALAAAVAQVADPARDLHDVYAYDRAGRQTSHTDGMGAVTTQTYDRNGNVTSRTDANNQVTRYAYDTVGRLVYTLGPLGQLEKNTYDAAGRITLTTRYAKAVVVTGLGNALTVDQLKALAAETSGQDQQQYSVYDKSGRLSATVDALGSVVTFVRDGNGNITQRTAWASPINMATWVPGTTPAPSVDPANDQQTRIFYDGMGREAFTVDALGYAVRRQYNAQGQLERITRYATAVPAQTANSYDALLQAATNGAAGAGSAPQITVYGYDAAGNRIRQTSAFGQPEAATTLYVYDGLGRLTRTVDPRGVELSQGDAPSALNERKLLGYINAGGGALKASDLSSAQREALAARYSTVNDYDAAGHKISVTDALGGVTRSEYDATGHVVRITDPRGNSALYYFDAAGRVTLSVDPEGYATATTYDPLGQTLSVKRHFNRVSGTYGIAQPPALPGANPSDALTRFEYDAAGRLSKTIDAESNSESYTYNALGQRETLTNKLGGVTSYTYDQLGRKVSETLPITSRNADGQSVAVVNRYAYDAFGNKASTTEAAGLPEQRVTQFKYDGLNREVEQRQAAVSIYTAPTGWTTATPTRRSTYDASGNLVAVVDPNGGRTRAWFDANNRKVAEVNATGTLSTWAYDAAGNVMAQNIYGDLLSLPVSDARPVPVNAANVRTTTYKVDANNRILSSTIAQVEYGEYNSKTGQYTVFDRRDLIQRSFYDANGNVVRQENAANAASLTWYDKLGQKVLEVDAMGYGVRWERDANGAVFRETRFAKSIALGSLSESTALSTILAKFEPQASDQITEYTYDRNGRTTSESRLGVASASVGADGTLTQSVSAATQRYGYDAMGNRTSVTDALNQRTDRSYDQLGRLLAERKPQAAVNTGSGSSALLRLTTEYEYDGLNNIRREIRRGIDNAVESDDEIVRYGYDATGVRTSMVTAKGETFTYGRDANGNNTAQMVDRQDADGTVTREMVSIAYDAANRETTRFTGTRDAANAPVYNVANTVTLGYNAWGELVSKRTGSGDANGAAQEYYDYDKAGRLWRSNSQGGVSKAWLYDMAGNATLQLESQRLNLRTMSLQEMTGNGTTPSPDILVTITSYDRNNRAVSVVQPKMDASRPNLIMYAATLNVESGQYGGLDIAVANPLAGTTSIQAPSDTSATGAVSVLGMPFSGGNIRPITNGEAGVPGKSGNYSSTVVGVTDIVLGSNDGWTSSIENIYGAVTWRVEVGGVPNYLGRVTNWPVTVHPRNSDLNVMMGQLPGSLVLGNAFANTQMLPIRIVATVQSSGQDIVVSNGAIRKSPSSTQDQTLSGTFMRLTAGEARDSDTIQLYSRPAGSTQPFSQTLPIFKAGEGGSSLNNTSVNGWYLTRLESLSGPTELMLVITQADGKVVRRESIQWNPATRQSSSSVAAAQPVFTTDNVAHFTGLQTGGTSPAAILVRSRNAPQGTGTMYWPAGTAGRFDVQLGPGNNDLAIDMLNDRGVVMDTLVGTMNPGSSLYDMRFIGSLPSSITFRDIPKGATTLTIEYSPTSAGGQPAGSVTLTRQAGKAEWVWDAGNLVADPRALYSYTLHFVARDADGFILTDATGNATIGAVNNGTKAALTGSVKHQILTFDPGIPEGRTLKIRYREKGATASDFIEATATRGSINAIFKWDATANNLNPAKEYEFLYDVYNAAGAVISNGEGYFKPDTDISNDGSNSNAHWVIPNLPGGPVIPGQPPVVTGLWVVQRQQDYDAFGHVISEFDGNGNETKLYYNTLGLLTDKVGPTVDITLANGQAQTTRPTEYYSHDLNGRLVGKRDANGNQSTAQIDAAGRTVAEWHPGAVAGSSTVVRKSYDIFGNLITVTDEIGRVTTNTYDLNNRLVRVDRPVNADGSHAFDTYEYDVVGQRIAHANALSFRERTYYDSMGRVTRYISAEGATVSYGYTYDNSIGSAGGVNTGGWVATTTDANGRTQTLKNDVFGRMMWKQDFGGHQFTYGYNWSGLIATQTGTSGQNISYTYYDNGYLRKVIDLGVSTESTFEYDNNGNRIFEGFKSTAGDVAMVFQWSRVSYDAYNRVKTIDDARYLINYEYDANGNRRRVKSTYKNVVDGSQEVQDYWYAYDGMNRFTVTMGQMVNGQIVRGASGDGVTIEYDDAGQRKAATYAANATDPGHREDYAYDGAGNLTTMVLDGVLRSRRTNDLAGRVTRYEEWFEDGALSAQKDRTWNKDNQLTVEVEHRLTKGTDGRKWSDTTTAYTLMKDGTLSKVDSLTNSFNNFNPSAQDPAVVITRMISNYAYEWWDGAKQTAITLDPVSTGYDPQRPQPPGYSVFGYDVNGHLKTASDINRTTPRTFEYWTNAEGQVLQRQELIGGTVNSQTGVVTGASKSRDHRYFYFDGKRVGNVGNDGVEREDYAQQLARSAAAQSPDDKYRKFIPTNSADFDENYQPINASFPGPAPGSYTVREGDTLENIARSLWGDAQLWYLLADANGLDGQPSAALTPNTVLQVPNKVTNLHNTSSTFRPYDPGKAMGDTSPTLPDPLPAPRDSGGGCGGVGQLIMAVVAVVVTIYTAGVAGTYFAAAGSAGAAGGFAGGVAVLGGSGGFAAAVGAGVLGGAAGSIASQAVGMAIGAQDSFSWKGVALGALGAGVGAGVASWLSGGSAGAWLAGKVGDLAAAGRMAIGNIASQGLSIATGLQRGFDWKGVAASAASGFVSASAGDWAKGANWDLAGQRFASTVAGGLMSAAVRGGSIGKDLPGIIGDAVGSAVTVGNVLGDSIVAANGQGGMTRGEAEERTAAQEVYAMGDGIPRLNGRDFSQDAAARRAGINPAGLPTYIESSAAPAADAAVSGGKGITQIVAELSQSSTYTARSGDSISRILGTSDPQAVGDFMRLNGLKSSTVYAGRDYLIPGAMQNLGDNSALGQNALNVDNSRLKAISDARAAQASTIYNASFADNTDARDLQLRAARAGDIAFVANIFGKSPALPATVALPAQWSVAEQSSPVARGATIEQVRAGGIDVRGGPSSFAAQGMEFGRLPGQELTPFQRKLGEFANDIPKIPSNLVVGAVEGGMNLMWGVMPGAPDYVPYLNSLRVPYNSPVSEYMEFGLGLTTAALSRIPNAEGTLINTARSGQLVPLLPESSLTTRQMAIHAELAEPGATATFRKRSVSMNDLNAIGRVTGDEYSMFTNKGSRLIIRGDGSDVVVSPAMYGDLLAGKYGRFSGHTHPPGYSVMPGPQDRPFLSSMKQDVSTIWGFDGQSTTRYTFGQVGLADDARIASEIARRNWARLYGKN